MDAEHKKDKDIEDTGDVKGVVDSLSVLSKLNLVKEKFVLKIFGSLVLVLFAVFLFLVTAPKQSYKINMVRIKPGTTVSAISRELEEQSIIRSAALLRVLFSITGTAERVKSGDYVFEPRSSMLSILRALVSGDNGDAYVWVTIPEGMTNRDVASVIVKKIPALSREKFIEAAKDKEGYLFPDTYHFSRLATEEDIIKIMHDTFMEKTRALRLQMTEAEFKKAIIIASMLEHEAYDINDGRIISGIIQNRLNQNMRLQIDATIKYFTGRGSADITRSDLAHSSPYNTYRHEGVPPTPIANPGYEMITAAIYPAKTKYIYYLHAPDKKAYYAETYDGHLKNRNKYLK